MAEEDRPVEGGAAGSPDTAGAGHGRPAQAGRRQT